MFLMKHCDLAALMSLVQHLMAISLLPSSFYVLRRYGCRFQLWVALHSSCHFDVGNLCVILLWWLHSLVALCGKSGKEVCGRHAGEKRLTQVCQEIWHSVNEGEMSRWWLSGQKCYGGHAGEKMLTQVCQENWHSANEGEMSRWWLSGHKCYGWHAGEKRLTQVCQEVLAFSEWEWNVVVVVERAEMICRVVLW